MTIERQPSTLSASMQVDHAPLFFCTLARTENNQRIQASTIFQQKKPRPKDCRGFQNTFRIVMGSTPAYSPLVRHGDEIIIAVK
jgi:hypothetical protein